MAGELSRDHDSYNHFNAGYDSRINPSPAIGKKKFSEPSRPGPMSGGADVNTKSKKFSHGLEW